MCEKDSHLLSVLTTADKPCDHGLCVSHQSSAVLCFDKVNKAAANYSLYNTQFHGCKSIQTQKTGDVQFQ